MLARVRSSAVLGIEAHPVDVEVNVSPGLARFDTVGLPDAAVKESRDRVKAAIANAGFAFPARRIVVNLAPADMRKEGSAFDLPIALGIIATSGLVPQEALEGYVVLGELSLDGSVKGIKGALPIAADFQGQTDTRGLVLPAVNAPEAAVVEEVPVYPVGSLTEAVDFLLGDRLIERARPGLEPEAADGARPPHGLRRCQRPALGQTGLGGGLRRRPQRAAYRPSRGRQEHAGQAPADDSAGHEP